MTEWVGKSLKELSRIRRGASPRPIDDPRWFAAGGPGWVRISDVTSANGRLRQTEQYLSQYGAERSVRVGPGNVLMSICATIGEPVVVDMDACIHDGFVVFDQFGGKLDRQFLLHELRWLAPRLKARGQTGTQANLNTEIVGGWRVWLPENLEEQSRISAALDLVDEAIAKTDAVIAKLKQVRAGLLHDLLTRGLDENGELRDPVARPEQFRATELGRTPTNWEVAPLVSRVSFPQGQVDPRVSPYRDWPLIAPDHVDSGTGQLLAKVTAGEQGAISGKYTFAPSDVIYSKIRPHLRKAVLARGQGLCSADMYPLRPAEGVDPQFLLAVILGEPFSRFAAAVSMRSGFPKINREEMAGFVMAWPKPEEQRRIGGTLEAVDRGRLATEGELGKLRMIKAGLSSDLLTGRVRVPESIFATEARP